MSTRLTGFSDNPMRTRSDFQQAASALIDPLVPYLRRDGAALDLGDGAAKFDMRASSLEGVVRPLWGLVPLAMGGGEFAHWSLFNKAIIDGVDPDHPNFWGHVGDTDQRAVEMAALGFFLALLPQQGWDALDQAEQTNLANWLSRLQTHEVSANNWMFFTILVQEGLRNVGRADLIDENLQMLHLQRLADWYLGDGWYGDGGSGAVDHYGGFAMHFYGLLYAWLRREKPNEFSSLFVDRAAQFALPFSHCFADNGEAMIQGRSLTYRFATAAFWGMLAFSEKTPLPIGVIKGLWARQLRLWRKRPIFRPDGLLSRGFAYPSLVVCEDYNSPTSPYWAMKAFMPLALEETSDFWQASEEALPVERKIYPMPRSQALLQRSGGHAIMHYAAPIHTWLQMDKYNKFAYSTACGFDTDSLQYAHAGLFGDNILAFSFDNGANWQMRQRNMKVCVEDRKLTVLWSSGQQEVETTIETLLEGSFSRTHRFSLKSGAQVVETGFAVNCWYEEAKARTFDGNRVTLEGENAVTGIQAADSLVRAPINCLRTNTNMLAPRTRIPGFHYRLEQGDHEIANIFSLVVNEDA